MNLQLRNQQLSLKPSTPDAILWLDAAHAEIMKYEQCPVHTMHLMHGGMYARTIILMRNTKMVGSIINKPTILVVNGATSVLSGDGRIELRGYNVIAESPGRKQFFWTHSRVEMTMLVATTATTIEEAEDEVFGEADQLISRRDIDDNECIITGE